MSYKILTVVLGVLVPCIPLPGSALVLEEGKTVPVVQPVQATPAEKTACQELSEYLHKLTGGSYPIIREDEINGMPAIFVGNTDFARGQGIDQQSLNREEWVMRNTGKNLILAGGYPRGAYYSVIEFLERQGVVWPDELTEHVPPKRPIVIENLSVQGEPGIAFRRITLGMSTFNETSRRFMARCRRNDLVITEDYGFGEDMSGCHTFHDYTSPDWPDEYFSLNDGKRTRSRDGGGPGQLCMSNPEMQKAVLAKLKAKIAADRERLPAERWPRIYDVSQNDNEAYCTCSNCLAIMKREEAYSGVLLEFINFLANGVAQEYPDVLIQTFAYCHTLQPPKNLRPVKNVLMRVCRMGGEFSVGTADTMTPISGKNNRTYAKILARWAEISHHLAIWEYWIIYYKDSFPYVNVKAMAEDIKTYSDYKVNNILAECESPECTSFSAFKQWLGYQMMVHPNASLNELKNRFFPAYYGKAAPQMLSYMHYMEKRMDEMEKPLAHAGTLAIPYLDREFFETANSLLTEAEKAAKGDENALSHIAYERIPVDAILLAMRAKFVEALPSGGLTVEQLFRRYSKNLLAHVAYYFNDGKAYNPKPGVYAKCQAVLAAKEQAYLSDDLQIPAEYRDRVVFDVNWSFGNPDRFAEVPDALFGKALKLPRADNYHRLPLDVGIYNNTTKKSELLKNFSKEELAQDEKFHYYSLGRHKITQGMMCWIHWSWQVSLKLDYAYTPDSEEKHEVLVSMKVTGEPYVTGSKSKPDIFVDRILILK
ncbi:MAG: DUF4838 domain-containing protein [Oligosphaeraceae bacterium]|nr:DUF4838 domain-containing protein [Oligosphaeraceae bacterium]